MNTSELKAIFVVFSWGWFGLQFFYWIGSALNTL